MSLFRLIKKAVNTVTGNALGNTYNDIIEDALNEYKSKENNYWWSIKANESSIFNEKVLPLSNKEKVAFIVYGVKTIHEQNKDKKGWSSEDRHYILSTIWDTFIRHLLKTKIVLDDEDIVAILNSFLQYNKYEHNQSILLWPLTAVIGQAEKQLKERIPSTPLIDTLNVVLTQLHKSAGNYVDKERFKIIERIEAILFKSNNNNSTIKPTWFPGNDEFATYANNILKNLKTEEQQKWFMLMQHSQKASGGNPSKKFLDEAKDMFKELGVDKFKLVVNDWFRFIISMKEKTTEHTSTYNGQEHRYSITEFIAAPNADMIKGFVWMCTHFHDKATLFNIAALAERSYRKIPGKGPAAAAIGNASLYVLANSKGLDGVGHLSRLRLRIKQTSTQTLIEKYLNKAAEQQGVSIHEIEDMAVDDFNLVKGKSKFDFDGFTATLSVTGIGKTELEWFKPDGNPQKSIPSIVKEKHAVKLKKIKDTIKQIELSTTAQRDRIDRLLKTERILNWEQFNEFYFSHGLMSCISQKLIWIFLEGDKKEAAIFIDNNWVNPGGNLTFVPGADTKIKLWHPVFYSVEEIRKWRDFLIEHKIIQPIKQAFREVYLLTDAEINTRTYSNRMAAHILKQHQFNSLAKTRGWKYSLMGAYDDGRDYESASINLPDYGLRAEFWINEVNAEDAFNDTGIWLYIATDQVRFVKMDTNELMDLVDVPSLAFSEVMRDVDLFVGVASVGNDPQWRDNGGLVQYRDYWQSYSFGDLTEVAKTRKMLLEKLVPRLKIATVAEIKDKFLVVKGKLRTYKIHLGSTNILMEPNDQYLCIVADRSTKNVTDNLFLPFEGDNGVSVILSKAMLLADDDKITDATITSQIKRR